MASERVSKTVRLHPDVMERVGAVRRSDESEGAVLARLVVAGLEAVEGASVDHIQGDHALEDEAGVDVSSTGSEGLREQVEDLRARLDESEARRADLERQNADLALRIADLADHAQQLHAAQLQAASRRSLGQRIKAFFTDGGSK